MVNQIIIQKACEVIHEGGVIAYPTEAVFGLGCDPHNEVAVKKILALKKRPVSAGLILIAADWDQIKKYAKKIPAENFSPIESSWPGPVTWLFPATEKVPAWIRGDHDSVALRVTDHPIAKSLCEAAGHALVSTSANLRGEPALRDAHAVKNFFAKELDYIVEGDVGKRKQVSEIRDAISGKIIR